MNNRPCRPGAGRCPWLAIFLSLVGVLGAAAGIWFGLGPGLLPSHPAIAGVAQDGAGEAPDDGPVIDLADLMEPNQHRVAFSGEEKLGGGMEKSTLEWLSDDQILSNLETVVFGSEFIGEDSDNIRKWTGPMRVAVYGDADEEFAELVESHLVLLHSLTGIDIARVAEDDPTRNAHILFLSRNQFDSYANTYLARGKPGTNRNIACFGIFKSNKREILEFHAMIPRSAPLEEVRACVVEELTQVLGLPNDSFDIRPSIFNDDDEYHSLTWQDELFLRVLYDSRIAPGMGRAEFGPLARTIIGEIRQEGLDRMLATKPLPDDPEQPLAIPVTYPASETPRLTRDLDQ